MHCALQRLPTWLLLTSALRRGGAALSSPSVAAALRQRLRALPDARRPITTWLLAFWLPSITAAHVQGVAMSLLYACCTRQAAPPPSAHLQVKARALAAGSGASGAVPGTVEQLKETELTPRALLSGTVSLPAGIGGSFGNATGSDSRGFGAEKCGGTVEAGVAAAAMALDAMHSGALLAAVSHQTFASSGTAKSSAGSLPAGSTANDNAANGGYALSGLRLAAADLVARSLGSGAPGAALSTACAPHIAAAFAALTDELLAAAPAATGALPEATASPAAAAAALLLARHAPLEMLSNAVFALSERLHGKKGRKDKGEGAASAVPPPPWAATAFVLLAAQLLSRGPAAQPQPQSYASSSAARCPNGLTLSGAARDERQQPQLSAKQRRRLLQRALASFSQAPPSKAVDAAVLSLLSATAAETPTAADGTASSASCRGLQGEAGDGALAADALSPLVAACVRRPSVGRARILALLMQREPPSRAFFAAELSVAIAMDGAADAPEAAGLKAKASKKRKSEAAEAAPDAAAAGPDRKTTLALLLPAAAVYLAALTSNGAAALTTHSHAKRGGSGGEEGTAALLDFSQDAVIAAYQEPLVAFALRKRRKGGAAAPAATPASAAPTAASSSSAAFASPLLPAGAAPAAGPGSCAAMLRLLAAQPGHASGSSAAVQAAGTVPAAAEAAAEQQGAVAASLHAYGPHVLGLCLALNPPDAEARGALLSRLLPGEDGEWSVADMRGQPAASAAAQVCWQAAVNDRRDCILDVMFGVFCILACGADRTKPLYVIFTRHITLLVCFGNTALNKAS